MECGLVTRGHAGEAEAGREEGEVQGGVGSLLGESGTERYFIVNL